jgi:hypothetical protein
VSDLRPIVVATGWLTRSGSGRDIAGIFLELPDRKSFPDYYKAILNPISLAEIEVCLHPNFFTDGRTDTLGGDTTLTRSSLRI